jgi:predicted  nucleic acid-binding Zn-ribbon protein
LDAKALTAMLDEIAHLKGRLAKLEDQELAAMETVEQAQAEVVRAKLTVDQAATELRDALGQREEAVAQARRQMAELRTQRTAAVGPLPANLLQLYDKARARYHGVGAAALIGRRCAGCGLEATTADYNGYLSAPPDEVLRCAECSRILVRTPA